MNNGNFDPFDSSSGGNYNEEIVFDFQPSADLKKEKRNFSRLGFGMAFLMLTVLVTVLVIEIIVYALSPEFYNSMLFLNLLSPVCIYGFGLPVLWMFMRKMEVKVPERQKMKISEWLVIFVICMGLMYLGANIGNKVLEMISGLFGGYQYSNPVESLIDYNSLWLTAIFTVVVAPIGEEFIFRKLIIDRTSKYGSVVSILISAFLFGLMHGNFSQFFYAFALGIVLGYVYFKTGNVWLTVALHAAINFVGSIFTSLLQMGLQDYFNDLAARTEDFELFAVIADHWGAMLVVMVYNLIINLSMVFAIILPIIFRKRIVLQRGEITLPKGRGFSTVLMNAGMITAMIVFGFQFLLSILPI